MSQHNIDISMQTLVDSIQVGIQRNVFTVQTVLDGFKREGYRTVKDIPLGKRREFLWSLIPMTATECLMGYGQEKAA